MTNQFILNAALLLIFVTTTFSQINISPDNSDIRYTGRWNFDDPSIPFVTWQGSLSVPIHRKMIFHCWFLSLFQPCMFLSKGL